MFRRIALISEHASPLGVLGGADSGGQNVYVAQVAKHLAASGDEVDIFTRRDDRGLPRVTCLGPGITLHNIQAGPPKPIPKENLLPFMEPFAEEVTRIARRQQRLYDIVHANFFMSGLVASRLKQELGIPFVITFHALGRVRRREQGEADAFPDERFAIEERLMHEASRVIAECPQDREDMVSLYGAAPSRTPIAPCGFDVEEFSPVSKQVSRLMLGLDAEEPVILQLGRLVPRKGIDTVILAIAALRRGGSPVVPRLLVVGGETDEPDPAATPEIGRLMALAEEELVADRVAFVGRRPRSDLRYYYSAADVFVTTPWYEPFGITPLEAMACGRPVIGTSVGGIKYTVIDGETGYLVPPRDPDALADRIGRMYKHPELMTVLGTAGLARVQQHFTWERAVAKISEVYESVLAERDAAGPRRLRRMALIENAFSEALQTTEAARNRLPRGISRAAELIASCFAAGNKLLICGNGGSAADAQHMATEFVGRFKLDGRPGLPALSLTADPTFITAWSNDVGYGDVFARQVLAMGKPGDVLLGISTSGKSENVTAAFQAAKDSGIGTIALVGRDGGDLRELSDCLLIIPHPDTQRIQEAQALIIHLLCELVEEELFGPPAPTSVAVGARNGNGRRKQRIPDERPDISVYIRGSSSG